MNVESTLCSVNAVGSRVENAMAWVLCEALNLRKIYSAFDRTNPFYSSANPVPSPVPLLTKLLTTGSRPVCTTCGAQRSQHRVCDCRIGAHECGLHQRPALCCRSPDHWLQIAYIPGKLPALSTQCWSHLQSAIHAAATSKYVAFGSLHLICARKGGSAGQLNGQG